MNAKRYIQHLVSGLLLVVALSTGSASAWDFDRTRAADIVDRAANDGDATAQLLMAMALDDRVTTTFDDLQFSLPANAAELYVTELNPESLYSSVMHTPGAGKTKEGLMAYALSGNYALAEGDYGKAVLYYKTAETVGERLIRRDGSNPDVTALTHDAKAGKVAAMRCAGKVPEQDTTYKIEKMMAGLQRTSGIAEDYRAFILRNVNRTPNTLNLEASACWDAPLNKATVVMPLAPYNYETNTSKMTGVLQ